MDLDVMCGMYKLSPEPHSWPSHITAYHLTPIGNVESILANGLTAKPCKATTYGEARTAAVYLFAHKNDTSDANIRDFLFDEGVEVGVLEIKIPSSAFDKLQTDGLFNMSCICEDGSYPFGMQYIDNIPAEWINKR